MRKIIRNFKRRIQRPKECFFCKQKLEPDYKEIEALKHFLSERGKITPRMHNGICRKHQKKLMKSIKRARFLALLPFIVKPS
ncbi:30S ribosomal protein S18 [Candidatus Gottesmanbacteria bacterium RIFCSPLOWO2_01_FULL_39_12b]|uniref:Small ribosomal subunit protein bS18 n=1 Tax=Candidatus Gottesmanbacteria bacterium RIFCSPLOWO2_01_FULL_39_12b TaxID=1798388 RepID=A0A1F6AQQ9_9BACT|nr:MAG: 30S ribosomal protein S18 [Candidatus Gottesmanbacteria bacterium RIFCSPLOWO2_01_FULL_39_12b]